MAGRIDTAECRALRAADWTLDQLRFRYGVSRPRVSFVCKGVVCPVDHHRRVADALGQRMTKVGKTNRARVRALFAAGHAPKTIAVLTGFNLTTVYSHLPPLMSPLARKLREAA
ncbi:hypothetical protein [Methylobacterium sp. D48H]